MTIISDSCCVIGSPLFGGYDDAIITTTKHCKGENYPKKKIEKIEKSEQIAIYEISQVRIVFCTLCIYVFCFGGEKRVLGR